MNYALLLQIFTYVQTIESNVRNAHVHNAVSDINNLKFILNKEIEREGENIKKLRDSLTAYDGGYETK